MNPRLIGINRAGVIDEIHWKFAVQTAIAAMGGFAVGYLWEKFRKGWGRPGEFVLMLVALSLSIWSAATVPPSRNLADMF